MLNRKIRKIRTSLIIVGIGLGLYGCAGIYSVVDFEVLEPANVSFPDNVNQLLVINRAPVSFKVFSEENRQGMKEEHLVMLDTLISKSLFRGLGNALQQSPIERFHTPMWMSERRADTAMIDDLILTRREVGEICSTFGADAIISLELYTLALDENSFYYDDDPSSMQTHYYQVSNRVKWIIYLPENPRPFDIYNTVDTLYFTDVLNGQFQIVPGLAEMIREAFFNSGMKYGGYLVPVWSDASRTLFRGREDSLREASRMTDRGDWDQAFGIWRRLIESGDSTLVAKSYNNMAIFYELEDDLDSASVLVERALAYDTLEVIKNYREELDIRLMNRREVLKQVR